MKIEAKSLKLKSLKHAKIRGNSKYIQVHATIDKVRYRFATNFIVSAKNLLYVENNYLELIDEYNKKKELELCDVAELATYGREVLENHCESQCKESTFARYVHVFKKYIMPRIGHYDIRHITTQNVKEILKNFDDLSTTNKNIVLCVLRTIFNHAIFDLVLPTNPFLHIKNFARKEPKTERNKAFNEEAMKSILQSGSQYYLRLYCYIAFLTGMRTNEILALHVDDIDLQAGYIRVNKSLSYGKISTTKTGRVRYVEILPQLHAFLARHVEYCKGYLFTNKGKFLSNQKVASDFKKLLQTLGLETNTLYATRHTFATLMLTYGEDIQWISNQLGHKDLATTMSHYIRFIKSNKQRASGLDLGECSA